MAVWQGALSWCSSQVSSVSGRTRWTLLSESFKDLTIVLSINCLLLMHEFLKNKTLTVEKTNYHTFDFQFAPCCLLWARSVARVPLRTLSFGFGIVLENPRSIICYDIFEKKIRHCRCVQEGPGTHSFGFPFVRWWDFYEPALHKLSACPVPL